jgi:hypothetical protein
VSPKYQLTFNGLCGVKYPKILILIVAYLHRGELLEETSNVQVYNNKNCQEEKEKKKKHSKLKHHT